jgi:uncharacterized protein
MKNYLIRLAPLVIACQMLAGVASAQQPTASAIAVARELVLLKGGSQMFDPVISGIVDSGRGVLMQTNPQLSKDLNDVAAQLRTEFQPRRDDILNQAARGYAQRFSEAEMKEMVTFFKSPLGQKMLVSEPQILDETFTFVQQQLAPRLGEEILNRFRAEMKKKGHNL